VGTGNVTIQISMNAFAPLVTVGLTGYDDRTTTTTSLGAVNKGVGNIQLVSGLLGNGVNVKGTATLANVITVTLPEPETAAGVFGGGAGPGADRSDPRTAPALIAASPERA